MAGEFVIDTPQKLKRKLEMVILFIPVICINQLICLFIKYDCSFLFSGWWDTLMRILIYTLSFVTLDAIMLAQALTTFVP